MNTKSWLLLGKTSLMKVSTGIVLLKTKIYKRFKRLCYGVTKMSFPEKTTTEKLTILKTKQTINQLRGIYKRFPKILFY